MSALADIGRRGRALYAGISSYQHRENREAVAILTRWGVPMTLIPASTTV